MPFPMTPGDDRHCIETTADGRPCRSWARKGHGTCYHHDPDARCTAPISGGTTDQHRAGERCRNRAEAGAPVCKYHGGTAPQVQKAAKRRIALAKAEELMATYGCPVETSPAQALMNEVCWTAGHVEWLRERVQEIEGSEAFSLEDPDGTTRANGGRHPLVWGVTRIKEGGEDAGVTEEAAPSVWLTLYWRERDHLVKVCAASIKAGVDERMVKLAESQGLLVAQLIKSILGDLDLTPQQIERVREVVPRHLRSIGA